MKTLRFVGYRLQVTGCRGPRAGGKRRSEGQALTVPLAGRLNRLSEENVKVNARALWKPMILLGCLWVCGHAWAQDKRHLSAIPDGFQFSGAWDCEGAMGNGRVHKSAFHGAVILDGTWLELTERDIEPATGYVAKYLIGFDSQTGGLVEFDANNFSAATYTSGDGWMNHTLMMTSPVSDDPKAPYSANRFVYTIASATTFTVDWQISRDRGLTWKAGDHLACQRAAGA